MGFRFGAILFALVVVGSHANAADWEPIGDNDKVVLYYDKSSVKRVSYPAKSTASSPSRSFVQVWVLFLPQGEPIDSQRSSRFLWAYDCEGNSAIASWSLTFNVNNPSESVMQIGDITAKARTNGLESYLAAVSPDSFGDMVQNKVCKKR